MSFSFNELKQAIQDFTENDETGFVTNLPVFIRAAEDRILSSVDLEFFRKKATSTLTQNNEYLSTPTDFLAPFSLFITTVGSEGFLLEKDVNFMREAYPVEATQGVPKYYSIFDDTRFIVGPTPDANYAVELHYMFEPESITTTASGESWLGSNAENALLYACLVEGYTFLKGEADQMEWYNAKYEDAVSRLKSLGEGYDTTDAFRSGAVRSVRI